MNTQERINAIIAAVVSSASLASVVEKTGMSSAAIVGVVAAMKKNGLVEYANKTITLTEEGKKLLPSEEKKVTKQSMANDVFARPEVQEMLAQSRRAEVKRLLMEEVGLTNNGAHTYIYNHQKSLRVVEQETVAATA